ncbi:hypothetical protein BJ165DRAFT_1503721 [Panaeolus papilionaceus]|nr:hypothetical protein BJ165DRAFT_1503721 [Panaeolus papilionaceus]
MIPALRKHDQGGRITVCQGELKKSKTRLKHIVVAESLEGTPQEHWMESKRVSMRSSRMTGLHQRVTRNGDPNGYVDRYQRVAGQNVRSPYQEKGEFISMLVSDTIGIHEAYVTRVGAGLDDWEMLTHGIRVEGQRRQSHDRERTQEHEANNNDDDEIQSE